MGLVHECIISIMKDIKPIEKGEINKQQGFRFRGIDTVYNELHALMAKHGIFTIPKVISERSEERTTKSGGNLIYRILTIEYHFYASDGSVVSATVIGEGMDSGDKASNKSMSIAHKYALLQVFCIPTDEIKDPDADTQPPSKPSNGKPGPEKKTAFITEKQRAGLNDLVTSHKVPTEKIVNYLSSLGIKKSKEIPIDQYETVCKWVKEYKEEFGIDCPVSSGKVGLKVCAECKDSAQCEPYKAYMQEEE